MRARLATALLLAAAPALAADEAAADGGPRRPLWEIGAGAAALRLPDYRGAQGSQHLLLPLPYLIYRGPWLRADRDGARAVLADGPRWELNLSASAAPPVRSRGSAAREGMADLPPTIELGPRLTTRLWQAGDGSARLEARVPVRAVIGVSSRPRILGAVLTPTLNLDLPRALAGWDLGLQVALDAGTRRLHDHLYGVSAQDATAARPAWQARGGAGGWHALAAVSWRAGPAWFGAYARLDRLDGAVFADSPLVRRRSGLSVGVAASWMLARSSEEVRSDD